MIKVEKNDNIQYFANRDAFSQWLVDNGWCRDFRTFVNDEYSAWEILDERYSYGEIKNHWWNSEVFDTAQERFDYGHVEVID